MLKKGQIRKKWAAGLLTAALAISAVALGMGGLKAAADTDVDTTKKCSLSIQMPPEVSGNINESSVTVKLYKVASVDENYEFTTVGSFSSLDIRGLFNNTGDGLEYAKSEVWIDVAKEAAGMIGTSDADELIDLKKTGSVHEGSKSGMDLGLYLMVVDDIYNTSGTVKYIFTPTLIPLPLGLVDKSETIQDYEYNINSELKYAGEKLYGNLLITKTLTSANSDYLPVSFVFHVTAVKDGEEVYNDNVSLYFTAAGNKSLIIENLPAGAEVTVEEVYDGPSYSLASGIDKTQTQIIKAEELVKDEKGTTAEVEFSNAYNGGEIGGHGVTNHYTYDSEEGKWEVVQKNDNTEVTNDATVKGSSTDQDAGDDGNGEEGNTGSENVNVEEPAADENTQSESTQSEE